MRFSNASPSTGAEERRLLRLLDIAYLSLLPPLLLTLKLPMLLFLALVLGLVATGRGRGQRVQFFIAFLGFVAIFLSLYGDLNLLGLSRLRLFVELLLDLLVLAVSLQRLTGRPNLYLTLSPGLLLALLLFFYTDLWMLAYVVVEIFLLLWLTLTWRMRLPLARTLRTAGLFYLAALPVVALLFVFFPRISFGHATYGFRGDSAKRAGFDGTMRLDAGALKHLSGRIVMEVAFEKGPVPPGRKLYFRGSVLYVDEGERWVPLPPTVRRRFPPVRYVSGPRIEKAGEVTIYKVTLYPTWQKWLYMLDLPVEAAEGASIDADFQTTLKKPVTEPQIYSAASALEYLYGAATEPEVLRYALTADAAANPRTAEAARLLAARYPDERARLDALLRLFRGQKLTYTLNPPPLDTNRTADSFLFDVKKGYCVHFAAAFATAARLAHLPARIVTGFKADRENSVENYLVVRERDAHAWVEVYAGRHWLRVEPTATAAAVESGTPAPAAAEARSARSAADAVKAEKLDLYLLYAKYTVETWILRYSRFRQLQLLEYAKEKRGFVLKFAGGFALLTLLAYLGVRLLRRPRCEERALCTLRPLLRRLRKEGFTPRRGETLHAFLQRVAKARPGRGLERVDELYHRIRYGDEKGLEKELKEAVKEALRCDVE